jgi:hypothetical protein
LMRTRGHPSAQALLTRALGFFFCRAFKEEEQRQRREAEEAARRRQLEGGPGGEGAGEAGEDGGRGPRCGAAAESVERLSPSLLDY